MSNPGSILAIDDQAVLLMNMAVTLEAEGYAVDTAIDESSALATAASTHPDVFLVDLRLGKSDGVNLISQLREICPDSIYVVMSAYADTDSTIRAMQNGAHDYLTKPFGDEELKLLINRSFQRLHLAREKTRAEEDLRTTNQELLRLNNRLRLMVETVRKIPAGSSPEEESRTMFVEFARAMHANGGSLYVRREG